MDKEEELRKNMVKSLGGRPGALAEVQAFRLLRAGGEWAEVLREELAPDSQGAFGPDGGRFRTAHPLEDCLVGNWIGSGRWMMLDLSAVPSDWGPVLGGDGSVTR